MSRECNKVLVNTQCPFCGKENEMIKYPVVNRQETPELAQHLINNTLYDKVCAYCGKTYKLDYSQMYIDEDPGRMVCYASSDEDEAFFVDEAEHIVKTHKNYEDMRVVRIVKDRNELREKARIFAMGLDDRIVEMFKVWGVEHLREEGIKEEFSTILCWILDDCSLEISFFEKDSDEGHMIEISFEQYQETEADLKEFLDEMIDESNQYYIDLDWAVRTIADNDL